MANIERCEGAIVIDHEARSMAQAALTRVEHTQDTLEKHIKRQENFEFEVRNAFTNLAEKMDKGHDNIGEKIDGAVIRIHARIDSWIKLALLGTLGILIGVIAYVWKTQVGG